MIIELEINGARVIISGDNLTVNLTQDDQVKSNVITPRIVQPKRLPQRRSESFAKAEAYSVRLCENASCQPSDNFQMGNWS
ncbi:hypothetical protein HED49_03130 [Ochrobactrum daejeonense]|nr:hypothetical protein [Brucella daejeonensis]